MLSRRKVLNSLPELLLWLLDGIPVGSTPVCGSGDGGGGRQRPIRGVTVE